MASVLKTEGCKSSVGSNPTSSAIFKEHCEMNQEDGKIKCKRCNGRGEYRVRFQYKDKTYYYFSKCGHCYARGYNDWVEIARGRPPGIEGMFCDSHPAGSAILDGSKEQFLGGSSVYDGHNYISIKTKRGEALWNEFMTKD